MEDTDNFCIKVCDSGLRNISQNVELTFPISIFFEMLLKDCLEDGELRITSYNMIPNSNETMYLPATSIIKRYYLKGEHYEVQDFDKFIIVKLRNEDPLHNIYRVGILHENEILAYSNIFPFLNQVEFCTDPLPIPEVYYAFKNVIIMEDLTQKCFYTPNKILKGISTYQCRLILKQLAKFHSHSLVCQMKEPKQFEEVKSVLRENLYYYRKSSLFKKIGEFFDILIAILEKQQHFTMELESAIKTFKNLRETFIEDIKKLLIYPEKHSVICHGDLRASNIFIHEDTGEIKFIDFQQICYSSIARDLVTLFYVNLQPRDMCNFTHSYVVNYLKQLHLCLKKQGVDLERELTVEWLHEEIMRFQVYGVVCGLWHSVEFYIENIGDWTSIKTLIKQKLNIADFGHDFVERAIAMLKYYENQTSHSGAVAGA